MHILTNVSLLYGFDLGFRWVITKKGPFITHATCVNKLPSRITQTQLFFLLLRELQEPDRDNFTSFQKYRFFLVCEKPICLWQELQEQDRDNFTSFKKIQRVLLSMSKTHMFMASSREFHHKTAGSRSSELFLIRTPSFFF